MVRCEVVEATGHEVRGGGRQQPVLDLVQAFVRYADEQGKDLPDNAGLAVTQALQSVFPCSPVAEKP